LWSLAVNPKEFTLMKWGGKKCENGQLHDAAKFGGDGI